MRIKNFSAKIQWLSLDSHDHTTYPIPTCTLYIMLDSLWLNPIDGWVYGTNFIKTHGNVCNNTTNISLSPSAAKKN